MGESKIKPYMCKHFKWASWTHYGSKMYEYACKLKGGGIGTCKGICEKFERKVEKCEKQSKEQS